MDYCRQIRINGPECSCFCVFPIPYNPSHSWLPQLSLQTFKIRLNGTQLTSPDSNYQDPHNPRAYVNLYTRPGCRNYLAAPLYLGLFPTATPCPPKIFYLIHEERLLYMSRGGRNTKGRGIEIRERQLDRTLVLVSPVHFVRRAFGGQFFSPTRETGLEKWLVRRSRCSGHD